MRVKIISDSTCDLSEALLRQWNISLIPMHILMGDESYLDGVTIHPADVFAHAQNGGKMPKSAAANLVEYTEFFAPFAKEYDAVIHISVSSKLSSCFQNAKLAAGEFENVYVVDSQTAAIGTGILAEYALSGVDAGMPADEIAAQLEQKREDVCLVALLDTLADALAGRQNDRGGCYRAGTGSAMYYLWHANEIGASPDGRRKGEPLGTNFSVSLFARVKGPVSVIGSMTKPHFERAINGGPLTLEFHQSLFTDEESIRKVGQIVKAFIDRGGHQLQLNAVNVERLKDAQLHPEKYPQLVVRIWGWSAYFVELDKPYQDHVIARHEYAL